MSKVTIAVPIYGVEKYIERCARSLFEQTYQDVEYLFLDDCTPDKSIEVLKRVMEEYPKRKPFVQIIKHNKNRGLAAARNTGVDNSNGDFILWVDSDDYIEKNTVEECMRKQKEEDYDIVLFDVMKHLPKGDLPKRNADVVDNMDLTMKLINGSVEHGVCGELIRLSLYKENNIRTIEGVNMAEDYMVTPKLAYCATRVAQIHQYFYHYDLTNPNSYSNHFSRKRCDDQIKVYNNLLDFFKKDRTLYNTIIKQYAISLNNHIKHALRDNDFEYYQESLNRLQSIDTNYTKFLSRGDRILYCFKWVKTRKIYIDFAYKIKQII